jgi:hypothetical protein
VGSGQSVARQRVLQHILPGVGPGPVIKGDPEDYITELAKYQGLGMAYGSLRMIWPGMDLRKVIRNVELFAQKVMPHFK